MSFRRNNQKFCDNNPRKQLLLYERVLRFLQRWIELCLLLR